MIEYAVASSLQEGRALVSLLGMVTEELFLVTACKFWIMNLPIGVRGGGT
jgi:hypothetical protein